MAPMLIIEKGGKLPLTFPKRLEDNPSFLNFGAMNGRVLYGEDVFVGYRFYDSTEKEVLFPFGHGLSYSTFEIADLGVQLVDHAVKVTVKVTNSGAIAGSEVVQLYVAQQKPSIRRPRKELKGFLKVHLQPGESAHVDISIDVKYATSFWDESKDSWKSEGGDYNVLVGNSSQGQLLESCFNTSSTVYWKGL